MQWNKPLSEVERASFRQCVIAALPLRQQADTTEQFREILLTDKRVKYLILAIKHFRFTEVVTTLKAMVRRRYGGMHNTKIINARLV